MKRFGLWTTVVLLLGLPSLAGGQAAPVLPPDHWAVTAARRAEALGLAPGYFPAEAGALRSEVAGALAQAASRGEGTAAGRLAEGWLRRFREEFPEQGDSAAWLGGGAGGWYAREQGRLSPARGTVLDRIEPVRVPSSSLAGVEARGSVRVGRGLAADVVVRASEDRVEAAGWQVQGRLGGMALSAGRTTMQYGHPGVGVVLGSPVALPRLELRSAAPWRVGRLGEVTVHSFLSSLDEPRHPTGPLLWGMRVAYRPHPRVTLAVNRASIFGGDSARPTLRRVAGMVAGVLSADFENQVVSVDGRYRLPTERWLPLNLYAEWAAEDGGGAWVEQPALVGGVEIPGLPGAPGVSIAGEQTLLAACCTHYSWYGHWNFPGNWVARDLPLGHPLGGEGTESALRVSADLADARLRLRARGFTRDRSQRSLDLALGAGNLFATRRTGRSWGATLQADARLARRVELEVRGFGERGEAWRAHSLQVLLRSLF